MHLLTVHTDTGATFTTVTPEDATRVAVALVREGHVKMARVRFGDGWTYHANGGGFPGCWYSGNLYRTFPGDVLNLQFHKHRNHRRP